MRNNLPLVSVIIPTYNRSKWLVEAIRSVLNQTYGNYEILVIDDGSEENIANLSILKNNKIKYFRNENRGVAFSRNYGIKKAKGKYIAFLDSDDFWVKNKLEVQVKKLEETEYKWSQHNYYYFDDCTKKIISKINTYRYHKKYEYLQFCSFKVQTSCFMVERKAVIENECYFDENKTYGEDTEFYLKMMKLYPLQFIDDYLGYFRIRGTNAGKDIGKQFKSRAVFWKEHCNDLYVRDHMSLKVRFAYKYCFYFYKKLKKKSNLVFSIVYFLPWVLFKCQTYQLESRR